MYQGFCLLFCGPLALTRLLRAKSICSLKTFSHLSTKAFLSASVSKHGGGLGSLIASGNGGGLSSAGPGPFSSAGVGVGVGVGDVEGFLQSSRHFFSASRRRLISSFSLPLVL